MRWKFVRGKIFGVGVCFPMSDSTPATRFFLSSALSPRIQASSRWIAVNAPTRKAFTLTGKDTCSPILQYLAAGNQSGDEKVLEAIRSLAIGNSLTGSGFLSWYRELNSDYPFLNYSHQETRTLDAKLMEAYAANDPAPPVNTQWNSDVTELSDGRLDWHPAGQQEPSIELLSGWLRVAAGITGLLKLTHSTGALRTSPSGGARHPTDVGVIVGEAWPPQIVGKWWYDSLEHRLVATQSDGFANHDQIPDYSVVFLIASHVRRAMWRYRDARAFRPVLIDAGHIVETLLEVISYCGWQGYWQPSPSFVESSGDLDPVFGSVVATTGSDSCQIPWLVWDKPIGEGEYYRTNPMISLAAEHDAVWGTNHLHCTSPLRLSSVMIDTLAYATPSSRNDRLTDKVSLCERNAIAREELQELIDRHLLLPRPDGDRLWSIMEVWSNHDWFLSLLAHCEEASGSVCRRFGSFKSARELSALPIALHNRRTCRAMLESSLPIATVKNLLQAFSAKRNSVKMVISTRFDLGRHACGTYYVHDNGRLELKSRRVPSEQEVVSAAIGQPWATNFSCMIWLIPDPNVRETGSWEMSFIECGRIAQHITLAVCSDPEVGVFQSPALVDLRLSEILSATSIGTDAFDGAYLVAIGRKAESPTHSGLRFDPASLFSVDW